MPPVGSPAGAATFSGLSATTASVVRNRTGDRRGVLQRRAGDLGRVDDACGEHVDVLAGGVEALADGSSDTLFATTPGSRPALRAICLSGASMATLTMFAPVASSPESSSFSNAFAGLDERDATTGDDALLDGRLRVADGVLDAVLALLELDLGGRTRLDDGDAAGELGEALLQLLAVVVAVGVLDLALDLGHATLDLRDSPAPSTIVVSSLVTMTLRALPSRSVVAFSSLRPTSSVMTWPPVRIAMSWSCALRRSPKPGP
jgi:hypothetical protein